MRRRALKAKCVFVDRFNHIETIDEPAAFLCYKDDVLLWASKNEQLRELKIDLIERKIKKVKNCSEQLTLLPCERLPVAAWFWPGKYDKKSMMTEQQIYYSKNGISYILFLVNKFYGEDDDT